MSAAALMDWLGANMPEEPRIVRSFSTASEFHAYMTSISGVLALYGSHDACCAKYLAALKARHPTRPRKAAPVGPPPVWDTRPISPNDAMAAVRAMCGSKS